MVAGTEKKAGKALKAIKLRESLASTVCLEQRYKRQSRVKRAGERKRSPALVPKRMASLV